MNKRFKSGLTVLILILIISVGAVSMTVISNNKSTRTKFKTNGNPYEITLNHSESEFKNGEPANKKAYIAALYVEGTIEDSNYSYNQKWIMQTLETLKYDSNNVGIALYIDSPGGGVYQADEVYLSLLDYKSKGKKVYAYMGPLAASGGYYISCAADMIFANRNTLTGSIGVISGQVFDLSELLYNIGIETTTIHAGENKNMGSFTEPFTQEQQEIMQSICDEYYEQFLGIVVEQRHLTDEKGRKLADGRVYTASQALNNGLIDKISDWNEMIKELSVATTNNPYCNVRTFRYEKKRSFVEEMMMSLSSVQKTSAAVQNSIPMYMYVK